MFLRRTKAKTVKKEPCTRCSILRLYFSAIIVIAAVAIMAGDKASVLSFVNKVTGVYLVLVFGLLVSLYRIFEWYFVYRKPKP